MMSSNAVSEMTIADRKLPSPGWLGWAILALAAIGLVLSAVSLVNHYKKSPTEYCDFSENFNCDIVNRSIYSEINGVPVAAIGVAGYIALMALSRLARRRQLALLMLAAAIVGLAFALYLTYIEAYVLVVWCIMCLGSLATISLVTLLAAWQTVRLWRA
jgi:vitamin-K-epoxide reductase (warfarin-sensitive)